MECSRYILPVRFFYLNKVYQGSERMSTYKLVTIDQRFLAETVARTGQERILQKSTRSYVGLYDEKENWYIPLRANLSPKKPKGTFFPTPFKTENPHFKNPGLDFQYALFAPQEAVLEIRNTLPTEQKKFIEKHQQEIKNKFSQYILSIEHLNKKSLPYLVAAAPLFPEGIEKIKKQNLKERTVYKKMDKNIHENNYNNQRKNQYQVKKKFVKIPTEAKIAARNTSILAYAASNGIDLVQKSHDAYRVAGTKIEISKRKNVFSDWSSTPRNNRNHSGGVVNFAMYMEDIEYYEAVQRVLEVEGSGSLDIANQKREPFEMPQIFSESFEKARNYLVNERKIDSSIVDTLHDNGLIKQTRNGEVAFIWAEGAKDVGLFLRGTEKIQYIETIFDAIDEQTGDDVSPWVLKSPGQKGRALASGIATTREAAQEALEQAKSEQNQFVKRIWRNSGNGEGHGFNFIQGTQLPEDAPSTIVFTEAAIDAISYHELYRENFSNTRVVYQSLEGRKESVALRSIERFEKRFNKKPDNIIIALDNDKAGNETSMSLKKQFDAQGLNNKREIPKGKNLPKDWNEQLKYQKSNLLASDRNLNLKQAKANSQRKSI